MVKEEHSISIYKGSEVNEVSNIVLQVSTSVSTLKVLPIRAIITNPSIQIRMFTIYGFLENMREILIIV